MDKIPYDLIIIALLTIYAVLCTGRNLSVVL